MAEVGEDVEMSEKIKILGGMKKEDVKVMY